MPVSRLDEQELRSVLRDLGDRVQWPGQVELVLVGGAAGILTGQLTRRLTSDCDVSLHAPKDAWEELHRRSVDLARERGLSDDWLNAEVQGLTRRLTPDWRDRAIEIGLFGQLRVFAIGRLDLIAMKFIAGRPEDRADLAQLHVTTEEGVFVHDYLQRLAANHPSERGSVDDALTLLEHGGLVHVHG